MTKRILAAVLGAGMFIVGTAVDADIGASFVVIGPGRTTSPACVSGGCDGTADSTTGTIDISKVTYIRVQSWCIAGPCVGVITVNMRSKTNNPTTSAPPFVPLISCTNPTTLGVCADGSIAYWNVPVGMQANVTQTGTGSGTFGVIFETHQITP